MVSNDVFAYIFGKLFGKTQLISLSPNKTVEGFVGGLFATICFSYIIYSLANLPVLEFLLCPQTKVSVIPFDWQTCDTLPDTFKIRDIRIPILWHITGSLHISEFLIHCVVIAFFAGCIAPFGGFFASGLKRSLKIKDFANMIPGHGGLTDRFDCLLVMLIFTAVYLREIVKGQLNSLGSVWFFILQMREQDKLYIYNRLKNLLETTGALPTP